MTVRVNGSIAQENDQIMIDSFYNSGDTLSMIIYSGPMPSKPEDLPSEANKPLTQLNLQWDMQRTDQGVKVNPNEHTPSVVTESGTASWAMIYNENGDPVMMIDVSGPSGNGSLVLQDTTLTENESFTLPESVEFYVTTGYTATDDGVIPTGCL